MPRQTEQNANNALGILLQGMFSRSRVYYENTRVVIDHPGLKARHIDHLPRSLTRCGRGRVHARRTPWNPRQRLGSDSTLPLTSRPIEAVIALRYPGELADESDLAATLKTSSLSYCVFTQERKAVKRFPESGWLDGSVEDLADLIRLVSVPQWAVDKATDLMQEGIDRVAKILDEMDNSRPAITVEIARRLGMSNVPQTRRMACAIIANAMVFHERIAGMYPGIKSLRLVCGSNVDNPQREMLAAWDHILSKINYWPIFSIGMDILAQIPTGYATRILRTLEFTASDVNATGVENSHDLTGRIFQTLISDRKYLATFYTLPASAALLARLAVAKMEGMNWADPKAIGKLRVADFACGTGALLSAVYEQIAARHERAGGNPTALHKMMMEEVLYGCDVMPSAVHITGSTLSGMQPAEKFGKSRLYPLAYGRSKDGEVKIGSLELLLGDEAVTLYNTSDPDQRIGSSGEETVTQIRAELPDSSYDLVIMNPPFTRATNHEGAHSDITNPAFAAFDATPEDQTAMGARINQLGKGTCYHGNAGIASAFAALAHKKLKPDGILALVLPLSAAAGLSWQDFRKMLADDYTDLTVISIAAANNNALSFSSDTGMAECLIIARKLKQDESSDECAHFTSFSHRPRGFVHASSLAGELIHGESIRRIEDGPYGGTPVYVGEEIIGEALIAPRGANGESWGTVRLSDHALAQTAYALSQSKLWLPGSASSVELKTALLADLAKLGLVDRDITGPAPRGPFDRTAPSPTATYPALWSHNATTETQMVCVPDSQLRVRKGMEEKAAKGWATASRAHISRGFRFNSQPLTVAFTEQQSIGGRAWPNVQFSKSLYDFAFSVWGNSTLGMLSYWWHANRQQSGRGSMSIRSAESLLVLNLRTLTDCQLAKAEEIFDEFRDKELHPAYLADADPNRALLDRRVICDLLGFDEETYQGVRRLAAKWCAEPSVHGGKKRPPWAKFVA